jgi:actin-related protein 6
MNMMDEYLLMERVKERLCYVAADAMAELAQARLPRESNPVAKDYVLPDGVSILRGYVKGDDPPEGPPARRAAAALGPDGEPLEQLLPLCNERFMVPEALLHPTDIGAPQAGLRTRHTATAAAAPPCTRTCRRGARRARGRCLRRGRARRR